MHSLHCDSVTGNTLTEFMVSGSPPCHHIRVDHHLSPHCRILNVVQRDPGGHIGADNASYVTYGIPWEPEEFIDQALKLEHPFDSMCAASDDVLKAMISILTLGKAEVTAH